jgi:RNA 3'-terminal phosphate cyclase (ATP)
MTIEIDGSQGEGGGQILRTALALSVITGQAFHIHDIRARRKSPGLMRQHLTAVRAAAAISGAELVGAEVGSTELNFCPGRLKGGDYRFDIGTAGSCTLVLQTALPALMMAPEDSRVVITGGTHNTMSPPFHFLQRAFLPLLRRMNVEVDLQLNRFGFYPAGGGEMVANIKGGAKLTPLHLAERGSALNAYAESYIAGLPIHIAERELALVKWKLAWDDEQLRLHELDTNQGPGNVLLITLAHEHITEVFTGFAEHGVLAEHVAQSTVAKVHKYMASAAAVGTNLADQLLLPLALAGGGSFTAAEWSQHADSNAEVIHKFLPVRFDTKETANGIIQVEVRAL